MSIEDRIKEKLAEALNPIELEVVNESELHRGHSGDNGTGQTHFRVKIVSDMFEGCSRVERHRRVNDTLEELFEQGLHALSVKCYTKNETILK